MKQTDYLIIFVVQEDRSLFSFGERFAMVHDGVADLDRVMVVPGGEFIISQVTFPQYFVKVIDKDLIENVNYDITVFAEEIASRLHISRRFVGEEREDPVTNEYNNAMKRILPSYGIELVEIPRLMKDDQVISASRVRKCLEEGDIVRLDTLVPESTKRILFGTRDNDAFSL